MKNQTGADLSSMTLAQIKEIAKEHGLNAAEIARFAGRITEAKAKG